MGWVWGAHGRPALSLQGWLNQLHTYDPELYHPSLTHSVLATLDGATLKLSYPKSNIPRQATFAEEILDVAFVSHRCYDMSGAKVPWEQGLSLCKDPQCLMAPLGVAGLPLPPWLGPKATMEQEVPHLHPLPGADGHRAQEQR